MRRYVFLALASIFLTLIPTQALPGGFFDFLYATADEDVPENPADSSDNSIKNCTCSKLTCNCCVNYNVTYVDLISPGCVSLTYVSLEEGLQVNVSYSSKSKQITLKPSTTAPEATCLNILENVEVASTCARFSELSDHKDHLRACLHLESKLLGDVTESHNVGCYKMSPTTGIQLDENQLPTVVPAANSTGSASEFNEEELIAAVNESAQQGLAFFSNLIGLTLDKLTENGTSIVTKILAQAENVVSSVTEPTETSSTTPVAR